MDASREQQSALERALELARDHARVGRARAAPVSGGRAPPAAGGRRGRGSKYVLAASAAPASASAASASAASASAAPASASAAPADGKLVKLRVASYYARRVPRCGAPEVVSDAGDAGDAGDASNAGDASDPEAARREAAFAEVAAQVARAKAGLDDMEARTLYMTMSTLDLYARAREPLREALGAPVVTNATMKMYEILEHTGIVPRAARRVRAFCNAELPGAFLVAVNAYVRSRGGELDWLASSYAPEAAADAGEGNDVFGDDYGLYSGNRDRWLMGPPPNARAPGAPPLSGDVTDPAVVRALAADVHRRFAPDGPGVESGATLYTSDAGIDVSADYNRQEELTALINFGQVLCGLLSLAPGGALVTKQYTFTTRFNRELITLVAGVFDHVDVSKPLTSRPANSEVYLVASGFTGLDAATAEALLARLATYRSWAGRGRTPCDGPPWLLAVPCPAADAALLRAAREVHGGTQVAYLEEAARWHAAYFGRAAGHGHSVGGQLAAIRAAVAPVAEEAVAAWVRRYPLPALGPADQLRAGPRQEKVQARPRAGRSDRT